MSINIHGKEYVTVAERLELAKGQIVDISTEVLYQDPVVIRATVTLKDGRKATGISAANPDKQIEKTSPYEVAETSALGRALGFLGYGVLDSIASAEEMIKSGATANVQLITQKQLGFLNKLLIQKGQTKGALYKKYNVKSTKDLSSSVASSIIDNLMKLPDDEVIEDFGDTTEAVDIDQVDEELK